MILREIALQSIVVARGLTWSTLYGKALRTMSSGCYSRAIRPYCHEISDSVLPLLAKLSGR